MEAKDRLVERTAKRMQEHAPIPAKPKAAAPPANDGRTPGGTYDNAAPGVRSPVPYGTTPGAREYHADRNKRDLHALAPVEQRRDRRT